MMSKIRRISPVLTATQIIPARVTAASPCALRARGGIRGGRFGMEGTDHLTWRGKWFGPVEGFDAGLPATLSPLHQELPVRT